MKEKKLIWYALSLFDILNAVTKVRLTNNKNSK
jgi:hypothetical protein